MSANGGLAGRAHDGEAVVLGVDGVSGFNALHSRRHDEEVQLHAFDILALDGEDLRALALSMRKTLLTRKRSWRWLSARLISLPILTICGDRERLQNVTGIPHKLTMWGRSGSVRKS